MSKDCRDDKKVANTQTPPRRAAFDTVAGVTPHPVLRKEIAKSRGRAFALRFGAAGKSQATLIPVRRIRL
jgi:hypothetical protein